MTMRSNDTYRGAIRNFFRASELRGNLSVAMATIGRGWRAANVKAKLQERAAQCAKAVGVWRDALASGLHDYGRLNPKPARARAHEALLNFWREQKPTRVRSRIIRELVLAPAA